MAVQVKVLESFVGNKEEMDKYRSSAGLIPWAQFTHQGQFVKHNVIELTEKRAIELENLKIVKTFKPNEPLDIPHERLADDGKGGFVDTLVVRRAERAAKEAADKAAAAEAPPVPAPKK